ncbi:hypothetical protein [Psychrobacillus sp. L3]|uniref:hypothetical protein n=1 Tax=Psychrobacillus sp. L3 TaxID=3236891 RepID=UPI0036F42798
MKNKTIKVVVSTAVAASAFVAATPSKQVDAATNIDQLMANVQNASNVLKWAISVEGSADGVTQPWNQYNDVKTAIANAEAAIKKLSFSEQMVYDTRLAEPKTQLKRAQGYLDAITASSKINEKTKMLSTAVSEKNLDKVEKAYHEMTAEFRKQTILLDRVYGQSTRDKIRNAVKGPAEKLINELKNDVTVHMLIKAAIEDIRVSRSKDATWKINEAQAILNANVLKWHSTLQKNLNTATNSLPIQIASISRIDNTTVSVKLNRAVSSIQASEFTFDNSLFVTNASLSKDGLTVTLTTSTQTPGVKYAVKYKGSLASFAVPISIVPIQIGSTTTQHRDTSEVLALSAIFAGSYGYNTIRIDIPAGIKLLTVNGIENVIAGAKSINVLPDKNGMVTITFTANNVSTAAIEKVMTFNRIENNKIVETQTSGLINFYAPAKAGSISNKKVYYVDLYNNYFVTADGLKYLLKGYSDTYKNEGIAVSFDSFKYALNIEDTVNGTYQPTTSSSFNIAINYYIVNLALDHKFAYKPGTTFYRMIGNSIELSGIGQPGEELFFYKNSGSGYLGKVKMDIKTGEWKFKTNTKVDPNELTTFYIMQQVAGKTTPALNTSTATAFRVVEGPFALSSISEDLTKKEATFTIAPIKRVNGTIVVQDQVVLSPNAFITVMGPDKKEIKFTNGVDGVTFTAVTNGFKITFPTKVDDNTADPDTNEGDVETLPIALDVIAIDGVTNAYGLTLTVPKGLKITGY